MQAFALDKELRSIRGLLKVEKAKKVQLEEHMEKEKCKPSEIRDNPEWDSGIQEHIRNRIEKVNVNLNVRQESIDLFKARFTNQIMRIKETIPKVLDKDTSLSEKIRTLFTE